MCGITGWIDFFCETENKELKDIVNQMTDTLIHRGPDHQGSWVDEKAGIALGHRRLSILDLSQAGNQPMISADGRYVLLNNGELYNFKELRSQLESFGYLFRSHSDTEVMLAAFCQWGPEGAVKKFNGMFAFALWDRHQRILTLGRDRLGEKPLYYGKIGHFFIFASELKAIRAHPCFNEEIDRDALTIFLRYNYIQAPFSIFKKIKKLPSATLLMVKSQSNELISVPYWTALSVAESNTSQPFDGSGKEAIAKLDKLLRDAVALRMVADVPLGAFLSGGVDSSTIVALMQVQSTKPIKTFTIGFYEDEYNEAEDAKAVANYLGTDHTELYLTSKDTLDVIPYLPYMYDEPFADSSQIPTFLVSQLAKRYVTVSLSGDGGDELFAGYNHYFWGQSVWRKFGWLPQWIRQSIAQAITILSPQIWNRILDNFNMLFPNRLRQLLSGDHLYKIAEIIHANGIQEIYRSLVSQWKNPDALVLGGSEPSIVQNDLNAWPNLSHIILIMMYLDMVTYLPEDILTKLDRASMYVSLEARVPYLDHRVVEFAWRLPLLMKIHDNEGKWLLRRILYQYVPSSLFQKPKKGFSVPIDRWLRGPLKDWAESLIDEDRLKRESYFDHKAIQRKWQEHLSGIRNWQNYLWSILMFQAWLNH